MDQADSCRRAAAEAVSDVEPPQLHDRIESVLDGASMLPGVLTLKSAAAIAPETVGPVEPRLDRGPDEQPASETGGHTDGGRDAAVELSDSVLTHAAGVQLVYEGLRLTRSIAHDVPWGGSVDDQADGDLSILVADILVARGFYLLAKTDAAGKAVRTVRAFGRDQARRDDVSAADGQRSSPRDEAAIEEAATIDANLERDVLELAVRAGAAAVDEAPSTRLLRIADELAETVGPSFPPAEEGLSRFDTAPDRSIDDPATDRATSATDP